MCGTRPSSSRSSANSSGADLEALRGRVGGFRDERLADLALARGWISDTALFGAQEEADRAGEPLGAALVRRGLLTPERLAELERAAAEGERAALASLGTAVPPEAAAASADRARRFGKFAIVDELGRGGMGIVHRAWQTDLGRWVALKRPAAGASPSVLQRFLREGRLAARVSHRHLVPVYEAGEEAGVPYLAMGLLEGGSLEGARLPSREAAAAVLAAAQAAEAVHGAGIVHRDIKPANLFRGPAGDVVLGDFGLAAGAEPAPGLSAPGLLLGTPAFAPPEQVRGERDRVDARSDVYALGATLHALLTGRPPFAGSDAMEVARAVVESEPPSVPGADADLRTIVERAMRKRPEERYAGAGAMAEDLRRWLDGRPILARRAGPLERARRWVRRHRVLTAAVASTLVAATALGLVLVEAGRRSRAREAHEAAAAALDEARRLLDRGEPAPLAEAGRRIAELESREGGRAATRFLRAELERLRGDFDAAEAAYARTLEAAPGDPRALEARGRMRLLRALQILMVPRPAPEWSLCCAGKRETASSAAWSHWVPAAAREAARGMQVFAARDLEEASRSAAWSSGPLGRAASALVEGRIAEARTIAGRGGSPELRLVAAIARALGDDPDGARSELEDLTGLPAAWALRGACERDPRRAVELLARAVALRPADPYFRTALAAMRLESGDAEGARADLPDLPEGRAVGVAALMRLGLRTEAREAAAALPEPARAWMEANLELGVPDLQAALSRLDRALSSHPGDVPLRLLKAHALVGSGRAAEARREYDGLLADGGPASWYAERAHARFKLRDYAGVEEDLTKALSTAPARAHWLATRGAARQALDRHAEAMEDFDAALEMDADLPSTWLNRARSKRHLGDAEGSIADIGEALRRGLARTGDAHLSMGLAYRNLKRWREAVREYTAALEDPSMKPGVYADRGDAHANLGEFDAARRDYAKALSLDPSLEARVNRALEEIRRVSGSK